MAIVPELQRNHNGEVHNGYRVIVGYPDRLVSDLLERFGEQPEQLILDPFCGAATSLVECKKRGIHSIGIDANPSSCFSARVKTNWNLKPSRLLELVGEIESQIGRYFSRKVAYTRDPTYKYIETSLRKAAAGTDAFSFSRRE